MKSSLEAYSVVDPINSVALSNDRAFAFTGTNDAYTILEGSASQDLTRVIGYAPEGATIQLYTASVNSEFRSFMAPSLYCNWKRPSYNPASVLAIKKSSETDYNNFKQPFEDAMNQITQYAGKLKFPTSNLLKSNSENRLFSLLGGSQSAGGVIKSSVPAKCVHGYFVIGDLYGAILTVTGFTSLDNIPQPMPGVVYMTCVRSVVGFERKEVIENSIGLNAFKVRMTNSDDFVSAKSAVFAWSHAVIVTGYGSRELQSRLSDIYSMYLENSVSVVKMEHLETKMLSAVFPGNGRHFPYPLYLDYETSVMATKAFMETR